MKLPPRLKKLEVGKLFPSGKSKARQHLRIVWTEGNSTTKVSYLSPTKLGNAVVRNRVRRMMRESFIIISPQIPKGIHMAILARPSILNAQMMTLTKNMNQLIGECFSQNYSQPPSSD